jgi:hypothetical protein
MAPTPAAHPSPPSRATLAGRRRPLDLDPPAPPPSRRAVPAGAPTVTGPTAQPPSAAPTPHHAKHQHQHDHDDQHPQPCRHGGLLGRRRAVHVDATAAHPSKQLGHSQATSQARIDGRATRRLAGPLHPATCPPIWAGRAGCQTGRRPRVSPEAPSPSGHAQPAQPQPYRPAHERRTGRRQPTRPQRAPPARYGEAEKRLPCLGEGTIQAWLC